MGAARTDRDTPRQDPCTNLIITETDMFPVCLIIGSVEHKNPAAFWKHLTDL